MKALTLMSVALLGAGLMTVGPTVDAQTLKKISDGNKVTVSYRESAVPFSYLISPTKAVGFAVDITEAIVDDIKKELKKPYLVVERIPVNAQNRIPKLMDGTYDLECGSTTNTSARGKDVAFAINHFYTGTRLLVQKSSNIGNYADLQNKTVASIAGSTNEKVLKKYAEDQRISLQIVYGKDYAEAVKLVEDGKAAAFAMDDVLLFGLMANSKQSASLAVVGDTLQVEPYLWDYYWFIDDEDDAQWFLDPVLRADDDVGELLRQNVFSSSTPIPEPVEHERGYTIKPYADYFYRWQGYALVDVIRFADNIAPIYSTPDVRERAHGMVRIAAYDIAHGLNSPERILTAPNRWAGLAPLLTWLDHFRVFRDAVFNIPNRDSAEQDARYRRGALLLAQHFGVTHEILADAIKNRLLVLASDWTAGNEKLDNRSIWTLRAWPHLQDDIQLAMVWLILLSGRTFEDYDAEWRQPYQGHWGWLALDKALPYDFVVHQKTFVEYASHYLKAFNETLQNPWRFDESTLPQIVRAHQRDNGSFAGLLAAFHELHEHLNLRLFDRRGSDFRELRPLDQYALLAIRAEGCLRSKLISVGRLDEIDDDRQTLPNYIKKLAECTGMPAEVIRQFNVAPKTLTALHGERPDPIGEIQSISRTLSEVNHQLVQAFLCCVLARNYFAHHVFLDHELIKSEKSAFMLRGILVTVLVLLGS